MSADRQGGGIKVYQKNALEFTETGAEGASVSFTLWETSTGGEPAATPVVTFDRPFLLFIAEKKTNACLLAGKIVDMQ